MAQTLTTPKLAARIVGLEIVAVDLRPFDPNMPNGSKSRLSPVFDPVITLSDGSQLYFCVKETEVGEYGVDIVRRLPASDSSRGANRMKVGT